jgi:hypothetical protein
MISSVFSLIYANDPMSPQKVGVTSRANGRSERSACWCGKVPQADAQIT